MKTNDLATALARASAALAALPTGEKFAFEVTGLYDAKVNPEFADPTMAALLQAITADQTCKQALTTRYEILGHSHQISDEKLGRWLLRRAQDASAGRAIEDLTRFVNAEDIPYLEILTFSG